MAKILVLYHSFYGHVEAMANAVAAGAREVAQATVDVKRVPETVPAEVFKGAGGKADQAAAVAQPAELANYDAILDEIKGGSPYGASTIAGGQGERMPSEQELGMARYQGKHVASIAAKLFG